MNTSRYWKGGAAELMNTSRYWEGGAAEEVEQLKKVEQLKSAPSSLYASLPFDYF